MGKMIKDLPMVFINYSSLLSSECYLFSFEKLKTKVML